MRHEDSHYHVRDNYNDDDLSQFEAEGVAPLPVATEQGYIEHDGARIWYAAYGSGLPVILLHGGLGHSGNWGYQAPALIAGGYRVNVAPLAFLDKVFS